MSDYFFQQGLVHNDNKSTRITCKLWRKAMIIFDSNGEYYLSTCFAPTWIHTPPMYEKLQNTRKLNSEENVVYRSTISDTQLKTFIATGLRSPALMLFPPKMWLFRGKLSNRSISEGTCRYEKILGKVMMGKVIVFYWLITVHGNTVFFRL